MTTRANNAAKQCVFRNQMIQWGFEAPTTRMIAKLTRKPKPEGLRGCDMSEDRQVEWKWPFDRMVVIVPRAVQMHGGTMDAVKAVVEAFDGSRGKDLAWVQAKLQKGVKQAA